MECQEHQTLVLDHLDPLERKVIQINSEYKIKQICKSDHINTIWCEFIIVFEKITISEASERSFNILE